MGICSSSQQEILPQAVNGGFVSVDNTTNSKAKLLSINIVFSVDISGSMATVDAYDRKTMKYVSRFDAVRKDIHTYLEQLAYTKRLYRCHLILFGKEVYTCRNVDTEQVDRILQNYSDKLESETRTDLAIQQANILYKEFLKEPPLPSQGIVSFFNHILTDGKPQSATVPDDTIKGQVADLLIEGMDGIQSDFARTTCFHQYGVLGYPENTDVSQFLSYLDNNLKERAKQYFRAKYPNMNDDSMKSILDTVDTGKQCETWQSKDPLRRKKSVNPRDRWDDNVYKIFESAVCD